MNDHFHMDACVFYFLFTLFITEQFKHFKLKLQLQNITHIHYFNTSWQSKSLGHDYLWRGKNVAVPVYKMFQFVTFPIHFYILDSWDFSLTLPSAIKAFKVVKIVNGCACDNWAWTVGNFGIENKTWTEKRNVCTDICIKTKSCIGTHTLNIHYRCHFIFIYFMYFDMFYFFSNSCQYFFSVPGFHFNHHHFTVDKWTESFSWQLKDSPL